MKVRILQNGKVLFQGQNCPELIGNRIALMEDTEPLTVFFYMVRPRNSFLYRCSECAGIIVISGKKPADNIMDYCPKCDGVKAAQRLGYSNMEDICVNKGKPLQVTVRELRDYLKEINRIPRYADRVTRMDMDAIQ